MNAKRWVFAVLLWGALALTGSAQESQEQAPPAEAEAAEPAPPQAENDAAEPAPPPQAEETRTLEEIFIPSEEIGADEEVTFPINI